MHNRKSIRLKNWNYTDPGYYFVTICANNRQHLFGDIVNDQMIPNEFGIIVKCAWFDLVNHNPDIALDEFAIMPNHIHGIIIIGVGLEPTPTPLSEIVRQFKTFSAKRINKLRNTPYAKLWQRNYYDHIIRNEPSLNEIRTYINNNPRQWSRDKYNP